MGARLTNGNGTPLVKLTCGCGHWVFERRHPIEDRNGNLDYRTFSGARSCQFANWHDPPRIGQLLDSRSKSLGIIFLICGDLAHGTELLHAAFQIALIAVSCVARHLRSCGRAAAAFLLPREEPFGNARRMGVRRRQGSFPQSAVNSRQDSLFPAIRAERSCKIAAVTYGRTL